MTLGEELDRIRENKFLYFSQRKKSLFRFRISSIKIFIFFSGRIKLYHIFDHLILFENSVLTNVNS